MIYWISRQNFSFSTSCWFPYNLNFTKIIQDWTKFWRSMHKEFSKRSLHTFRRNECLGECHMCKLLQIAMSSIFVSRLKTISLNIDWPKFKKQEIDAFSILTLIVMQGSEVNFFFSFLSLTFQYFPFPVRGQVDQGYPQLLFSIYLLKFPPGIYLCSVHVDDLHLPLPSI